jgi:hypothetical protein
MQQYSLRRFGNCGYFEYMLLGTKMTETLACQMAKLHLEVQTLQAKLQTTTKDLSLVSLVAMWAGTAQSSPLHEFLQIIESTAKIGNWSMEDMVRIATLKLTDTARNFFNASPELHEPSVSWDAFNTALQNRFGDPRSDQYHYTQLQQAKQKPGESAHAFADRCRNLAQKVTPLYPKK